MSMTRCRVQLLDGTDYEVDIDKKATGEELLDKVCEKLTLSEKEFFGLTYMQSHIKFWLNTKKQISKQIKKGPWIIAFELKFYPDPMILQEDTSRYQVFLQVRRDILCGKLPCSFITLALLSSYAVQSQIGDNNPDVHGSSADYIKAMEFSPMQNDELLEKIAELHRTHRGMNTTEAELYFLDNAKTLALYGVHMHEAKDSEGGEVSIGVCAAGLLIYKDRLRINRLTWPKILKIRYKRNYFHIDVRPDEDEPKMRVISYKLTNVKMAKRLWRIAVEHHAFFRLREPEMGTRTMFSRNPYRYSGRTLYQSQRAAQSNPDFRRGGSKSMDNLALGYSTERWEKQVAESSRTATLDLRRQRPGGSMSELDQYTYDPAHQGQIDLLIGGNRPTYNPNTARSINGSQAGGYQGAGGYQPDVPGYQTAGGNRVGYNPAGSVDYNNDRYATGPGSVQGFGGNNYARSHDGGSVMSQDGYGTRQNGGPGRYGDGNQWNGGGRVNSRPDSVASDASSLQSGAGGPRPPRRKRIVSKGSQQSSRSGGHGSNRGQPRQQYDNDGAGYSSLAEMGGGGGADWAPHSGSLGKTQTRTYVAQDGTVVTEYRTERNGVIETHIEKRTRVTSIHEESDVDYDKELADAIFQVTKMNPDLTVQKIEIQTRSEEV